MAELARILYREDKRLYEVCKPLILTGMGMFLLVFDMIHMRKFNRNG